MIWQSIIAMAKKVRSDKIKADFLPRESCGCHYEHNTLQSNRRMLSRFDIEMNIRDKIWFIPSIIRDIEFANEQKHVGRVHYFEKGVPINNLYDKMHSKKLAAFMIFYGDIQYGIIMMEIEPQNIIYWQICSLQFGTLMHFEELNIEIYNANKELEEKNRVLNFLSEKDELTGILNRHGFMERAIQFFDENFGKPAQILFADLDHLKQINDGFGHVDGDFAISSAADLLKKSFSSDTVLARIGGDEFVALICKKVLRQQSLRLN